MALSQFSFVAKTAQELRGWFVDIMNHLGTRNYRNGIWVPMILGMTGTPSVSATYQRFGTECSFTIIIGGTHATDAAEITLPERSAGSGMVVIHSLTSNSTIGTGSINKMTDRVVLPNYTVTDEEVIVRGFYTVSGI
jgi:hypothetical protein